MKRKHAVMALIPISILAIGAPIFFLSGKSRPAETVKPSIPYRVSGTKILVARSADGITADTFRQKLPQFSGITEIEVEDGSKNYADVDGMLLTKDGKELIACPPGFSGSDCKVPSGVAVIGKDAFRGCEKIVEIELPDGVSTIESGAFADNPDLEQITIPKGAGHLDPGILSGCKDPVVCGDPGSEAQKLAESQNLIFQPAGADSVLPPKPAASASDNDKMEYKVSVILARLRPDMSDVEKVKAVNQYLAENVAYDMKDYLAGKVPIRTQSIIGALVDGQTTCNGYSMAFHLLMQRLGIPDDFAVSAPMDHMWNMVQLGGNWYHVDVTWDRKDLYGNFLKSDVAMEKAGWADDTKRAGHYGWTGKHKAVSTKYDNFDWAHAAPETIDRGLTVVRAEVTPSPVRITGKAGTSADFSAVSNLGEALTARSGDGHIVKISEAVGSGGKTSWKIGLLQKGVTMIHIRSACNAVCDVPVTVL